MKEKFNRNFFWGILLFSIFSCLALSLIAIDLEWLPITTPTNPLPSRGYQEILYYPTNNSIILFGGARANDVGLNDLWEFDGSTWTQKFLAQSPPSRYFPSMSYDTHRDVIVLFGGEDWPTLYNDTWEFDGQTWTETSPSSAPEGRAYHCMIYNSKIQKTVLFGGSTSGPDNHDLNDTWVYSRMTNSHVPTLKFSVLVLIVVFLSFLFLKRSHIV